MSEALLKLSLGICFRQDCKLLRKDNTIGLNLEKAFNPCSRLSES